MLVFENFHRSGNFDDCTQLEETEKQFRIQTAKIFFFGNESLVFAVILGKFETFRKLPNWLMS